MKVAYFSICGIRPFRMGGPANVASYVVRQLSSRGVEVVLVLGIAKEDLHDDLHQTLRVTDKVEIIPVVKDQFDVPSLSLHTIRDVAKLTKVALRKDIDIVHFNDTPNTRDLLVPIAARLKGVPQVYNYHGWVSQEMRTYFSEQPIISAFDYIHFGLFSHIPKIVVVNAKHMINTAVSDGFPVEAIRLIPNGVSVEEVAEAESSAIVGDPSIVYVGRLEKIKGVDMMITAFRDVLNVHPNSHLHLVGEGNMEESLKKLVRRLDIEEKVTFHGFVAESRKFSILKAAEICVFPSRYEPFGISVLEAMAAAKPIVASRVGGIAELVTHHQDGVLCEPEARSLAEAICMLWGDNQLMSKIANNALATARRYDWGEIVKKYIEVYYEACALNGSSDHS